MKTFTCWLLSKIAIPATLGILMLFCIVGMISEHRLTVEDVTQWSYVVVPIDFVLSVCATIFTYRNFDEVYSRSKRWRNNNVEKFDMRLSYCIFMFIQCLLAVPFLMLLLVLLYNVIAFMCRWQSVFSSPSSEESTKRASVVSGY